MKSVCIFVAYFGPTPGWMAMFLESCRCNPTISWFLHTDLDKPVFAPANVTYIQSSFTDYCSYVSSKLGIRFRPEDPYSLCNVRPMTGHLHRDIVSGFDYFGWGDIDVIYGNIRNVYDDTVLSHNVISAGPFICTGHLFLVKTEDWLISAYNYLTGWKTILEERKRVSWWDSLDEARLTALFSPVESTRLDLARRYNTFAPNSTFFSRNYFEEQWATPFTPGPWIGGQEFHPEVWYWENGRLTNENDGTREFLYLHLMNFKAKRFINTSLYGASTTWDQLPACMLTSGDDLIKTLALGSRIRIDRYGIKSEHSVDPKPKN